MSYLQSKITIEEFLNNITKNSKRDHFKTILNTFNSFCNQKYSKSSQEILDDLFDDISKTHSNDKIYVLFSHFKEWLLVDHPEIVYYLGRGKIKEEQSKPDIPIQSDYTSSRLGRFLRKLEISR